MKRNLICMLFALSTLSIVAFTSCGNDEPIIDDGPEIELPDNTDKPNNSDDDNPDKPTDTPNKPTEPSESGKILIAYFSWGGTTQRMAQEIASQTSGTLFGIEPAVPYPTEYTPCTEVALEERDKNARPAIKNKVENMDEYDVVFIGCPVWWHTAPMIISTFTESYNLSGKTVVPFCTYAATYRDETLEKIVSLTPTSKHLKGLGLTGSNQSAIASWLKEIGLSK